MVENLENEVWKVIEGYPMYLVSNMGRVKRIQGKGCRQDRLIKACKNGVGYMMLGLLGKTHAVHLLVAEAFIYDTKKDGFEVNHKNLDKTDNRAENLEYITHKENCKSRPAPTWPVGRPKIPVRCIDTGEVFESLTAATAHYGKTETYLSQYFKGKAKHFAGYQWEKLS